MAGWSPDSVIKNLIHLQAKASDLFPSATLNALRGLPYLPFAKCSDFFTPSPFVTYRNQLILLLLSAFWEPHPPLEFGLHIWKPP